MDPLKRHRGMPWAPALCLILLAGLPATADLINVPGQHPTIRAAIDAADHGDTIVIAPGTWTGPDNRDLDTRGKAIVIRSLLGPETCIIDCQNLGRGFHFHSCESAATAIAGLTIRNGLAERGGGIEGYWSSPRIVDCIVSCCSAAGEGGGIAGHYFSAEIIDCRIEGCRAMDGGGVHLDNSPAVRLIRCTIEENQAERHGGGFSVKGGSAPLLLHCTISDNSALLGGGLCCRDSTAVVQGCLIEMNQAWDGGGLFSCGPLGPHLLDTRLSGNKADCGGAVYAGYGGLQLTNCLLTANSATVTGGALYGRQLDSTISGCTFSGNSADQSRGGGISSRASRLVVVDSILWGNVPDEVYTASGEQPQITFSNVAGSYPGAGNLDSDPLFTCAPCGSHCLCQLAAGESAQSPCIDAGSRPARSPAMEGAQHSSGTITRSDWGTDTGRLDLGYHHRLHTVQARIDCLPAVGWLPFRTTIKVTLVNPVPPRRRFAGRVDVTTANGVSYPNWRRGWTDLDPGKDTSRDWSVDLPDLPELVGTCAFSLTVEDVTPPPYNLPPYPPSGHRAIDRCGVTGILPPG